MQKATKKNKQTNKQENLTNRSKINTNAETKKKKDGKRIKQLYTKANEKKQQSTHKHRKENIHRHAHTHSQRGRGKPVSGSI